MLALGQIANFHVMKTSASKCQDSSISPPDDEMRDAHIQGKISATMVAPPVERRDDGTAITSMSPDSVNDKKNSHGDHSSVYIPWYTDSEIQSTQNMHLEMDNENLYMAISALMTQGYRCAFGDPACSTGWYFLGVLQFKTWHNQYIHEWLRNNQRRQIALVNQFTRQSLRVSLSDAYRRLVTMGHDRDHITDVRYTTFLFHEHATATASYPPGLLGLVHHNNIPGSSQKLRLCTTKQLTELGIIKGKESHCCVCEDEEAWQPDTKLKVYFPCRHAICLKCMISWQDHQPSTNNTIYNVSSENDKVTGLMEFCVDLTCPMCRFRVKPGEAMLHVEHIASHWKEAPMTTACASVDTALVPRDLVFKRGACTSNMHRVWKGPTDFNNLVNYYHEQALAQCELDVRQGETRGVPSVLLVIDPDAIRTLSRAMILHRRSISCSVAGVVAHRDVTWKPARYTDVKGEEQNEVFHVIFLQSSRDMATFVAWAQMERCKYWVVVDTSSIVDLTVKMKFWHALYHDMEFCFAPSMVPEKVHVLSEDYVKHAELWKRMLSYHKCDNYLRTRQLGNIHFNHIGTKKNNHHAFMKATPMQIGPYTVY